jgi:redox-sensitive bicupin YhaK (pirin superfamily)
MVAKVVSGQVFGVKGPIEARTPTYFIDFLFNKNSTSYEHEIPAGWNAMILCYEGSVKVQKNKTIQSVEVCHFKRSAKTETFHIETLTETTRILLLAGKPLDEPIANYGPFVLNTQDQLKQAFDDFHAAKNGFENAQNWRSEIREMKHAKRSTSQ